MNFNIDTTKWMGGADRDKMAAAIIAIGEFYGLADKGVKEKHGLSLGNGPHSGKARKLLEAPDLLEKVMSGAKTLNEAIAEAQQAGPIAERLEGLKRHPHSDIWGSLADADMESVQADIEKNGLGHPIIYIYEGKVLDGWHRLQICLALGRPQDVKAKLFPGNDAEAYAFTVSENCRRRQLTKGQLACVAWMECKDSTVGKPSPNSGNIPNMTQGDAAKKYGVTEKYIRIAGKVHEADEDLFRRMHSGEVGVTEAEAEMLVADADKKEAAAEAAEIVANQDEADAETAQKVADRAPAADRETAQEVADKKKTKATSSRSTANAKATDATTARKKATKATNKRRPAATRKPANETQPQEPQGERTQAQESGPTSDAEPSKTAAANGAERGANQQSGSQQTELDKTKQELKTAQAELAKQEGIEAELKEQIDRKHFGYLYLADKLLKIHHSHRQTIKQAEAWMADKPIDDIGGRIDKLTKTVFPPDKS